MFGCITICVGKVRVSTYVHVHVYCMYFVLTFYMCMGMCVHMYVYTYMFCMFIICHGPLLKPLSTSTGGLQWCTGCEQGSEPVDRYP